MTMTMNKSFRDRVWQNVLSFNSNPETAEENSRNFYLPVFERTRIYRRIAGYFSSSAFNYLCKGLGELIENDGIMYLITSSEISIEDAKAIERGEHSKEELLIKPWTELIKEVEGDIELKNNFEALAWLLANDRLQIKIGFNVRNGERLTNKESKFHEKIAIFEDYYGDKLLILGSTNESYSAYTQNREFVSVQESWKPNSIIDECMKEFEDLWYDTDPNSKIMDVSEVLRKQLAEFVPNDPDYRYKRKKKEYNDELENLEAESKPGTIKELREYQVKAIDAWVSAGYRGIINMATGTGKTFTALNAIKLKTNTQDGILLIVVPQSEIAEQWRKDCIAIFGGSSPILLCSGTNPNWRKEIGNCLYESAVEFKIIITINNTFSNNYFIDMILPYLKRITIIVDEVHEIGAPKTREKLELLNNIPKRLGLSATPERMRDQDGNAAIMNYFGDQIFYFSMHDAINPPSGDLKDRYLCPYKYYVHYSSLTSEELEDYRNITMEIKKYYSANQSPESMRAKKYDHLCRLRSQIIKGSTDRLIQLTTILNQYDPDLNPDVNETYSKCIIYCNNIKESDKIFKIMRSLDLNVVQYHSNLKNREKILETFETSSFFRYIISIGCLDQGVDLPICDGAIILSSTSNERQYIQRRGRVLRLNPKKKMAFIHDIVVTPYDYDDLITEKQYLDELESSIILKQIKRVETFIDDSDNLSECESKLFELKRILW